MAEENIFASCDAEVVRRFKAACAKKGKRIKIVLQELMESYLEGGKNGRG